MSRFTRSSRRARLRSTLFGLGLATLLGGCATAHRVPLSAAPAEPVTGIVGLRQQEIGTTISRSNITTATGGGLIFALVDAGINNSRGKKAESTVGPIRDALLNYEPGIVLASALREQLAEHPGFTITEVDVRQVPDDKTVASWIAESGASAVLFVDAGYELLPAFDGATVSARVSLHRPKAATPDGAVARPRVPPTVYFNHFSSRFRVPGAEAGGDTEAMIYLWCREEGQPARVALDGAFREIAEMLAYDLAQPAPAKQALYKPTPEQERRMMPSPENPTLVVPGHIERRDGERVWVRLQTGELAARES